MISNFWVIEGKLWRSFRLIFHAAEIFHSDVKHQVRNPAANAEISRRCRAYVAEWNWSDATSVSVESLFAFYSLYMRECININKRHAMHAEAMTFHKGSLIIFRTFVKKLGYIKVTDNFCAEWLFNKNCVILAWHTIYDIRCKVKCCLKLFTPFVLKNGEISVY